MQLNYTVGDKELFGIVEGLKAFAKVICCQEITVHTDHLNQLFNKLPSQHMMQWRLLLEKYHPQVVHIAGIDNDTVETLSRLDLIDKADDLITSREKNKQFEYVNVQQMNIYMFMLKYIEAE